MVVLWPWLLRVCVCVCVVVVVVVVVVGGGEFTRFVCEGPKGRSEVRLPIPGVHMAMS